VTTALGGSVELLERALGYTRARLVDVHDDALHRRTPCDAWRLGDLLAHMEDALDAFTEAAGGAVEVPAQPRVARVRVAVLQQKACTLLGAWGGRPAPGDVVIRDRRGGLDLGSDLLVATAALEVTVHGWDVGQATGRPAAVPPALARELLEVATRVVHPSDRGVRFAAPRPVPPGTPDDLRLLAFLGRA